MQEGKKVWLSKRKRRKAVGGKNYRKEEVQYTRNKNLQGEGKGTFISDVWTT
jgi:hypothetical protein